MVMMFNCWNEATQKFEDIPADQVLYVFSKPKIKYKLFVHVAHRGEFEWGMMGAMNSTAPYLKQFGFLRLDTNYLWNSSKKIVCDGKKRFGKIEVIFEDGAVITVSRTGYDLHIRDKIENT